ncbi:DUF3566 domain-containing protein [Phycicoccus endophyticus]|uniref:DUF3566 domain-containing protein n=1 Tax=Phycicoccus endophyticus TaxID=1690220 RepID=A0A7G9R671_9MICO|nr:DUF3566 domain-containing protein [Phycicoccus endophyticus]QNN51096.1 DUF3566 domain-containing protein [Phycicoccus endophyticus]
MRQADAGTSAREATRPVPTGRSGEAATSTTATAPAKSAAPAQPATRDEPRASERPVTQQAPRPAAVATRPASARRVRLTVSRIDPWSAMKISFLLSVALGIALVVATVVLWTVLDAMGVFDQVNGVIGQVIQDGGTEFDILDFVGFTRVVSLSIVIGVVDVILMTAIATLAAFLYNVSSALVGGVQLTLTDD